LALGFTQFKADGTLFGMINPDPHAPETSMATFLPDASAGMFVYHYDWHFGVSAQQLFNNNIKLTDEGKDTNLNRIKTHFYGYAGYRLTLIKNWRVEPSVLFRHVISIPAQMDFNIRVIYDETLWGGIGARNTLESFDDLSLIFGYTHNRKITVGLSYDLTFAKIRPYSVGTFELVLGWNFEDVKRGRGVGRSR
jgi:type IX secretion system PorP/SprF family membrane protein